jgi:hypothetical protein
MYEYTIHRPDALNRSWVGSGSGAFQIAVFGFDAVRSYSETSLSVQMTKRSSSGLNPHWFPLFVRTVCPFLLTVRVGVDPPPDTVSVYLPLGEVPVVAEVWLTAGA